MFDLLQYGVAAAFRRLNQAAEIGEKDVLTLCRAHGIRVIPVFQADLPDTRMQNMVVLSEIHRHRLIPGIDLIHYRNAMTDLMPAAILRKTGNCSTIA
jgi:indolepyruvate ferredoxin oxidoreductase beta subunit